MYFSFSYIEIKEKNKQEYIQKEKENVGMSYVAYS
jgi:hypothetical protein